MLLLNFNTLRSLNQIEIEAFVNNNDFNDIRKEKFDNSEKVIFRFFELNESISRLIKKESLKKHYYLGMPYYYYDYLSYKSFILKNMLSWWSLDIELKRDEFGCLTNESHENVLKIHPSLLNHFLWAYDEVCEIPDEDTQKITDQCHNLFRKGSKGISDADESISVYCNLTGFWEKLGLNYFDIQKLPDDLFNKLNLILRKDNEIQIKEFEKMNKSSGKTGGNIIDSYQF
jgi:hypothetical protein